MSSPLKAFRKHQKKLIVIFGVLLMVSFTVLGVVQQYMPTSTGQQSGNDVFATWKYGEITRSELQTQRVYQQAATIFMSALAQEAAKNGGSPQVPVLGGDSSEMGMAQQMLLVRKAEDMGIVITDDTINQYLAKLTDDSKRSPEQFEAMYEQLMKDRQVNYKGFLRYMRQALMAQDMYVMGTAGLSALSPGEAKSYHDRIYRHKKVELLPIKVDDYLSTVTGEPSESELEKVYEKGEDRYTTPPAAEPGFRRRHKIKFAYFKGDADKFRELEEAKITDEQIAKYYEEHKEDFKRLALPGDLGGESSEKTDLPGTTIKPIGLPELNESAAPKSAPDPDKNSDDSKSSDQTDSSNKTPPAENPDNKSSEKNSTDEPGKTESDTKDDQSRIDNPFDEQTVFVSLDDDAAADKPTEKEAQSPSTAEKSTEIEDDKEPVQETGTGSSGNEPKNEEPKNEEPKGEYKPLEEVKDQIRSILAKEAVIKQFEGNPSFSEARPFQFLRDKAFAEASRSLRDYYRARNRWIASKDLKDSDVAKPNEPDWEAIAAANNLAYGETPLADQVELADTEIGKLTSDEFVTDLRQQFTLTFAQKAFNSEEKLFNASEFPPINKTSMGPNTRVIYFNSGDVRYLYWKAAETEEYTPPLSKIRNEVAEAWRTRKARELAFADAKEKMKQVEGSGKSLSEVFGKDSVLRPREFTWLSTGGGNVALGGGRLGISEVEGVEKAGPKFHEAVALLEENEIGIATNQAESVVYVVQVERDDSFPEFTKVGREVNELAGQDRTVFQDWLRDLEREFDVEWKEIIE